MTSPLIHPARQFSFDELLDGLKAAQAERFVHEHAGPDGLRLFVYTSRCVYETAWNVFTTAARGLILDPAARRVVATPFPKFFNAGEGGHTIPDLPFETFEKLDGSLIVVFHHLGRWLAVTKGAFASDQAKWAQARLDVADLSGLVPGTTYLAEATYPENRIVIHYADPALVLLAAYAEDGLELDYDAIRETASRLGWQAAERHAFASVAALLDHASALPRSREGFVMRFADGLRLKVKGAEYRRIHALISGLTPLTLWEALSAGDDLEAIRREIPEEFWDDFDRIVGLLQGAATGIVDRVAALARGLEDVSDKDLGLRLATIDPELRPHIFNYRKRPGSLMEGKTRQALFRAIRPVGNVLPGYVPSFAMNRVVDEGM
ncbi:MAG: 2'-5' RNA ligase [Acetobacteraceae bacterium]|nr:2'-5' RNA ligase [Acetobacteraceae bacterium]